MGDKDSGIMKIAVTVAFLVMVLVNGLANALPINGITTGQVSDAYPDLFAPAGITFSIWGLIYILLAAFVLYQWGLFQSDKGAAREDLFQTIGIYFIISSVANTFWIFAWHYEVIWLSLVFMIVILLCLIQIANQLRLETFSLKEKFFIRLPFSIYFGWITVATIANVTTFLVSLGLQGFGTAQQFWMILVLFVGIAIGIARMRYDHDLAYGLVFIWAYAGILIKHISPAAFGGQFPAVITAVIICLVILAVAKILFFFPGLKKFAS